MGAIERALVPPFDATVGELLLEAARAEPERVVIVADGREITLRELAARSRAVASELSALGVGKGDPVLTMLGNGPHHCALFLGIALAGALWAPVNPALRGPSLAHVLATIRPRLAYATHEAAARLKEAGLADDCRVIVCEGGAFRQADAASRMAADTNPACPDDVRAVLFTSGTTGPPKGVMVSERMLVASAAGTALACDCADGDVFVMWEPLHHIGGSQILVMALARRARLVIVERFSASALWRQVREHGVTKLHYLGGILEILLTAAPRLDDRDHPVRLAFGGGCRPQVWRAFEERFAIPIREVYGMTEASSFTTVNVNGAVGSVGTDVPWFETSLLDGEGAPVRAGETGEIVVRPRFAGLLTQGYLGNGEATTRLLRGGLLHSGDLGRRDKEGNLYFLGRVTDSLRRRGENVSAWEVETALALNPAIAESAVVGVPAAIGEHDILCFVSMREGREFDAQALARWCCENLPPHHVPRYFRLMEEFPRTPSQRIRKDLLDRDPANAIDTAPARDRIAPA
jgi:crotonobetaine/carnitine-CoA ligase